MSQVPTNKANDEEEPSFRDEPRGRAIHVAAARAHKKRALALPQGSAERAEHLYAANMHLSVANSPLPLNSEGLMRAQATQG
jgi:hypothetical protein